jgi:plastocyanin
MHEIQMLGDQFGYRFEPGSITIQRGDSVRFVMVSGGPHNIAFDSTAMPAGAAPLLSANMPKRLNTLMGPMMLSRGESYIVSFGGVPAGQYFMHCTPHLAMDQRGVIEVR